MRLHTLFALSFVVVLTGCRLEPTAPPQTPRAQQAEAPPTKEADSAENQTKAPPELPAAGALIALIDRASRIEAKSGTGQEPTWSRDLTRDDIDNLKVGIGDAFDFSGSVPRCLPTVVATIYQQEKVLATLGAFCDGDSLTGPIRFDIGELTGSFTARDLAKVGAALRSQ